MVPFKIGFGFDTHKLEEGRPFRLGGIEISHHRGPAGHSDADVLIHAICDAMLGAVGLRDIGSQFPDTDPAYKNIDSRILLRRTNELLKERGYSIGNIDSTVVCETPRLSAHIPAMVEKIAIALKCGSGKINVKAKTEEGLGFTGTGEGIKAYAVALLERTA